MKTGIPSLSFDFAARKIPEGRMRGIIDALGEKWSESYIHGTNVPHFNWHGTWRKPVLPTYDLLVSTYGFDSFGNVRPGIGGGEPPAPNQIKEKMQMKRYKY